MVWGMNMPSGFGEFWPNGNFEGGLDWDSDGWGPRLSAYYREQTPEMQRELFHHGDEGLLNDPGAYAYYVSQKFINEPGALIGPDYPPLSPIRDHEPPRSFNIVSGGKSLGSLIELSNQMLAVDATLRAMIERLEPNTHQFFPIEIKLRNGKTCAGSYFTLVLRRYLDSFSAGNSAGEAFRESSDPRFFFNEQTKKGITGLALSKDVFGNAHLWRERSMLFRPLFFSDELQTEIAKAGLRIPRHYRAKEI
jgi:hypothetical protein